MSININDIYCKHWLINNTLIDHIKKAKHDVYITKPHHCFHIIDTIHYKSLVENTYDLYNILITDTNQYEHSIQNFKNLFENFDINKMNKIELNYNKNLNKYIITDGVHRICIMIFKDLVKEDIPLEYFNILNK